MLPLENQTLICQLQFRLIIRQLKKRGDDQNDHTGYDEGDEGGKFGEHYKIV